MRSLRSTADAAIEHVFYAGVVSASNRDKRSLPRPRLVRVVYEWSTGPAIEYPALLLEWRRVERDGRPDRWEGLVCMAKGGGEQAWSVEMRWVLATELRPVD